jgi:thioredoxin reductase (NADPH)
MWDVVVVGAGPGGISAGIWGHRLGLKTLVIEARDTAGGQLNELHGVVIDYPGLPVQRGIELAPYFVRHLESLPVPMRVGAAVASIDVARLELELAGGERLPARSLVLATGSERRRLNIPGERSLWGCGVSDSPTRDRAMAIGKTAIVIGGGDAALENALLLADLCPSVSIVHRRERFRARAEFVERVLERPGIRVYLNAVPVRILGEGAVTGLEIDHAGHRQILAGEVVFVKIGVSPRSGLVQGQVELDGAGYVRVNGEQQTGAPWVYAVGDVCNPVYSSIANAVGQGMVAAKAIEGKLRGLPSRKSC